MEDGSAVILSVAKYYSPSGKAIQDTGVTPNVPEADTETAQIDNLDDDSLPDPSSPAVNKGDPIMKRAIITIEKPLN